MKPTFSVFVIRKFLFALLVLLLPAPAFAQWTDSTLYDSNILNPSVDKSKILAICSGCFFNHQTIYDYMISDVFRFQDSKAQFNADKTLYFRGTGNILSTCKITSLQFHPLIYFTGSNLADTGDLYVLLYARLNTTSGGWVITSSCYHISNVNLTNDTLADISNYSFNRVENANDWIFPLFMTSSKTQFAFSTYLTKNCNISANTVVLSQAAQSNASLLQLNSHFSAAWLRAASIGGYNSSLTNAGAYIVSDVTSTKPLYSDQQLTTIVVGSPPATNGPAGYVSYSASNFSVQNDFDRGGQLDWSEFYQNKDMRNAADDKPNIDDIGSASDIPSVDLAPIPGQTNLDEMYSDEVEPPTVAGFRQMYDEVGASLENTLDNNPAYRQFKSVISPEGFNRNADLPSYSQRIMVNMFGGTLDLGNVTIDFNFLREEPFRSLWSVIRAILDFSLFTMTFLACLGILEKSQAWSAD